MLRKRAKQVVERVPGPFDDSYINKILSFQLCDAKMKILNIFLQRDDDITSNITSFK